MPTNNWLELKLNQDFVVKTGQKMFEKESGHWKLSKFSTIQAKRHNS